jgi:hypothetical protein
MPTLFNKTGILPSGLMLTATGTFLWLSTTMLVWRADASPRNYLLHVFRALDRFFDRMNEKMGDIRFTRDEDDLPQVHPVCWREMTIRSLCKYHYLIRLFLPIQGVVTLVLLLVMWKGGYEGRREEIKVLSLLVGGLWFLVLLVLGVQGSSLIASEKVNQTLDILLATPLSGEKILLEKAMAFRRLLFLAMLPLGSVFVAEWILEDNGFHYLFCSILTLAVYMPMLFWVSIAVGLHVKSRHRAVASTLGLLFLWTLGPLVLGKFWGNVFQSGSLAGAPIGYLSPASIIFANELNDFESFGFIGLGNPAPFMITLANTAIYGFIALMLRVFCTSRADTLLGRPMKADELSERQIEKLRRRRPHNAVRRGGNPATPPQPVPRRP